MPDFAVSIAIRSDDKMTPQLKRLSKEVNRFGSRTDKAFSRAAKSAGMFKSVLGGMVIGNAINRSMYALQRGVGAAVESFIDLDQALVSAGAKFGGIKKGTADFERLDRIARKVGATTEFTAKQAGEGLEFLAMAGFDASQAVAALPVVVDLATASNTDLARATDIASDALGAFGMQSDDASENAANLKTIVDVFAKTTTSANVDMENLFETFKQSGPIMTTAGQSLESFAAMTAIMGNAGIKGSLAGTTLKNTIMRLVAPVGAAKKQLRDLGVEVEGEGGKMRDVASILEDFADATKDMGEVQRTAAISTIFGARAVSGVSTMLDKGIPSLRKFRNELKNANGAASEMSEQMRTSLLNRLKTLQSSLLDVGMRVIEAFEKEFPNAIDMAIEAVRNFDVKPIIEGIRWVVDGLKEVFKFVRDNWTEIKALAGVLAALKVAMLAVPLLTFAAEFLALAKAQGIASAAQWALNAAMLANPIGLVIALIVALIAVIILIAATWEEMAVAWRYTMSEITMGTNDTFNSITETMASMVAPIMEVSNSIGNHFGELWHMIKRGAASTVKFVISAWKSMKSMLGFDVSGVPSAGDIDKWFGVDKPYEKSKALGEGEINDQLQKLGKEGASLAGAYTREARGGVEGPNRAREESMRQSVDIGLEVAVNAPEPWETEVFEPKMKTKRGHQAPNVDWRAKSGKN